MGDGVRREGADRCALAAVRRRRGALRARSTRSEREPGSATSSPRARGARPRRVGARVRGVRRARQGTRAARLRAAYASSDGARAGGQRARRRPQPVGRIRGRPVGAPRPPARRRATRPRRDRDRGPGGDHGLDDPLQVPARRVRRPDGRVGGTAQCRDRMGCRGRGARHDRRADRDGKAAVQRPGRLDARGGLAARAVPVRAAGARLGQDGDAQRRAPGVDDRLVLPGAWPRADGSAAHGDARPSSTWRGSHPVLDNSG